jgi:hypothetical protein
MGIVGKKKRKMSVLFGCFSLLGVARGVEAREFIGCAYATFDFLELLIAQVSNYFFAEVQLVGENYLFHGKWGRGKNGKMGK